MRGPDVYGPAEACQLLGISRQRLHELRKGDTFPPETRLEIGAVFDGPALRAYDKDRRAPKKARAVRILASYRKTGAVKTTARNLGISRQEALEATGTFGNLFTAMGVAAPKSAELSKGIVTLSSDLASFNNANPADVLAACEAYREQLGMTWTPEQATYVEANRENAQALLLVLNKLRVKADEAAAIAASDTTNS